MADVFSYNNNANTGGQIASSELARISVKKGGGRNALVQSLGVGYRQQIEEVVQVGSPQIYWIPGKPQGTISIESLVGQDGFFKDWQAPCGIINTASVKLEGQTACGFSGTGSIQFTGAIVESLQANITSGRQTITQGAQIRTAGMSSA